MSFFFLVIARYLFWSDDGGTDHKIVRARMDGTNPTTIMAGGKVKSPASKSAVGIMRIQGQIQQTHF